MAAIPDSFLTRYPGIEDVPAVARLEAHVFTDPWPAHLYVQEIGQPLRFQRVIFDPNGFLAGYLFACWQADELHILKVATHPIHEGKGLASMLMEEARQEAVRNCAASLILEVRPSNRRAISLYRHLGYQTLGRRPRYYADGEDALVMAYNVAFPRR
jgi:[ribosomal protein S18]-alanine N-acetyltransferase